MTEPEPVAPKKRPAPPADQTRRWQRGLALHRAVRKAAARREAEAAAEPREDEQ